MGNMMSSAADYAKAMEGVYYASEIVKKKKEVIDEYISELKKPNVMSGATGEEFCKKLESILAITDSLVLKMNKFTEAAIKKGEESGMHINNEVAGNFEEAAKKFASLSEEIKEKTSVRR